MSLLFLYIALAALLGFLLAYLLFRARMANAAFEVERQLAPQLSATNAKLHAEQDKFSHEEEQHNVSRASLNAERVAKEEVQSALSDLKVANSVLQTSLVEREAERNRLESDLAAAEAALETWINKERDLQNRENVLAARLDEFQQAAAKRKEDEDSLRESFRLLSVDALAENNKAFLPLAKEALSGQKKDVETELDKKQTAVEGMLKPMKDLLDQLHESTQALEVKREGAYEGLLTEVKNIKETHESLRIQTHQLVSALKDSGTRGNWGAVQLKRCLEFAGMLEHCCFELEKFVRTSDEESQRPDCVVTLPDNRLIIIDAKTPMKSFLDALAATDEKMRDTHLAQHARQLKTHLVSLQSKAYWKQFKHAPDFVICFLPQESLLSAALSQEPDLITFEGGKVLLATPTTLIMALRLIAFSWTQIKLAQDAHDIHDLAVSIYDKLASVHDSFELIGKGIKSTAKSWETMRTQVEGRGGVFSIGKRLQKLNISQTEMAEIAEIQLGMHEIQADDWQSGPVLLAAVAANAIVESE